jgi:hypothetical protein
VEAQLAWQSLRHDRPQWVLLLRRRIGTPLASEWGSRHRAARFHAARLTILGLVVFPSVSFSQGVPLCQSKDNVVSISQPSAPQGVVEVHVVDYGLEPKEVQGIVHLDLRNDGPPQLKQLCASAHLADANDAPGAVAVALSLPNANTTTLKFEQVSSCLALQTPWSPSQNMSFDLHVRVNSDSIPLSGVVLLDSTLTSKEKTPPPRGKQIDCTSSSKPLTRSVILLPSKSSCWLGVPLLGGLIVGAGYLLIALWCLRRSLDKPMGGPQWGFGTSFATNFTVGTGLLSLVLGGSVITDALHYLTKFHYVLLSLLFAAFLLIAPALFSFFSRQQKFPSSSGPAVMAPAGWVWLYIVTSALMVGAVVGQLITVGLAISEAEHRGYIGNELLGFVIVILSAAVVGTVVCAANVVPSYLKQKQEADHRVLPHLESFKERVGAARQHRAEFAPAGEIFTDQDEGVLDHLMEREKNTPPKWNMF